MKDSVKTLINLVKGLTEENNHTKALQEIVDYLFTENLGSARAREIQPLLKALSDMCSLQNYYGEMTQPLQELRTDLQKSVFWYLKNDAGLSEDEKTAIYYAC